MTTTTIVDMTTNTTNIGGMIITKVAELEKNEMLKALVAFNGNKTESAKALGMGRATFYRKFKKYSLSF